MVGPARPLFVLFGSSIVQYSFSNDGWGSALADIYARKVYISLAVKIVQIRFFSYVFHGKLVTFLDCLLL